MTTKTEFMLLFRFEPNMNYQPSEAEMNEMQQDWGAFFGSIASQGKLVSTHQLGFEGTQIFADQTTIEGIHVANNQTLGGNVVIQADSMQEAIEIGRNCPIFKMGGSVEVRSIQPM